MRVACTARQLLEYVLAMKMGENCMNALAVAWRVTCEQQHREIDMLELGKHPKAAAAPTSFFVVRHINSFLASRLDVRAKLY
jgi:hypothetical protein